MTSETVAQNPEISADLLSKVPGEIADLYRRDSRFSVAVIFLPELEEPNAAHICIFDEDDQVLEEISVKADPLHMDDFIKAVLEIYRHPLARSKKAADYVSGRS